jgi:histidine triad (HIT) family protein
MNRYEPDCVFCRIVRGVETTPLLDEGRWHITITPLNPVVPGHCLFIPKTHVDDFADDPNISGWMMETAGRFVRDTNYGECNLITSRGVSATQTVFHLHLHVIPRKPGDGLMLPWTNQEVR